ncbi:MAG: ATP-dependent zinc protease [Porticoccaceae bacterium]|nr:ATP-dependent zinc protease [Porticoccaceae bacterium]
MKFSFPTLSVARLSTLFFLTLLLAACVTSPTDEEAKASPNNDNCPSLSKRPDCPTIEQKACPSIKPRPCPASPAAKIADKQVIGETENVKIEPPGRVFLARIDTGAAGTSIHASNIVAFERDGRDWVRFQIDHPSIDTIETPNVIERPVARTVLIKQASSETLERRLVVKMTITLGSMTEQIDVSLSERTSMTHPVLIGRNFLRNLAIVDVSQRFIAE